MATMGEGGAGGDGVDSATRSKSDSAVGPNVFDQDPAHYRDPAHFRDACI